jgi:hypothetical protein
MNVMHIIGYVKKALKINESSSLYVEASGTILSATTTIAELSEHFTETDGFVYLKVKT